MVATDGDSNQLVINVELKAYKCNDLKLRTSFTAIERSLNISQRDKPTAGDFGQRKITES